MANYKNINLEKGMYGEVSKSFGDVLESLDPSENYENTELGGMDAFSRQLKRFGIKVGGQNSSPVSSFFGNSQSSVLFPEYIKRAVKAGMEEASSLSDIVATTTFVDASDYRTITSKNEGADKKIGEGEEIPKTTIKSKDNLVKLNKRGRLLVTSYEAIKHKRIDLFTVMLKQVGRDIARAQMSDAVDVLLNGDGNNNNAPIIQVSAAGKLSYSDLLNLWGKFLDYDMNTIIAGNSAILKMAELPEFKNPLTGLNFENSGTLKTPMGSNLIKSAFVPDNMILAIDKNSALEKICQYDDVVVEHDKLIDRQLEQSSIISIVGFAKIANDATKALKI